MDPAERRQRANELNRRLFKLSFEQADIDRGLEDVCRQAKELGVIVHCDGNRERFRINLYNALEEICDP